MITCIVFDVGNVLVRNGRFPQTLIANLAELLAIRSQFLLSRYRNLLPKLEANQSPISSLLRRKVFPNLKTLYQKAAQKTFRLNKEAFDLALKLKKRYQVGIISNVDKYLAEIPLHQKVYRHFDQKLVVLSYKVGTRKPQEKIYRLFLKQSGCRAQNVLFIDNTRENVLTAKKLGMKGIVFKNNRQFKKELTGYLT
jgi:putative hydrolase of the HAD superfamily